MTPYDVEREALRVLAPPPDLTCSQWADQYRQLSPESSSEPGQWKTYAFQREILDAISDQRIKRVVVKACTQVIKTEAILNGIGYFAHQDPGPILVLQPRGDDAKAFSKERIATMIRDTPVLSEIFTDGKSRSSDNTIDQKMFRGGMLAITSAGSVANLARRAIRFLFCDEVDKYTATSEGDPIALARKRLATFRHRSKEIDTCSPTVAGSNIDRAYEGSDKRERFVPCPYCGHMQSMMGKFFKQVRWQKDGTSEERAKTARYHCEACDKPWDDSQRIAAIDNGEWRASKPFNGIAGFWISELYSPWKTMAEIVLDFLTKKDDAQELQTFVNTSLAENWEEKGDAPEWETLISKRESYTAGTVPQRGLFLTAGVDVQKDRIECQVVAWGRNRERWAIDYKIFIGNTAEEEVWRKLEEYRVGMFPHESGHSIGISRMFVDSGDQTQTVYAWVRKQPPDRVTAIKGSDKGIVPVGPPSPVDVTENGKKISKGLRIKIINVSFFKSELYANLKARKPTDEEIAKGYNYPQGYCHFADNGPFGDEYFKQLCSEQLVTHRNKNGRTVTSWQQTRPRNEALDTMDYARGAAYDLGYDRMQEKHFEAMEWDLKRPVEVSKPQQKQEKVGIKIDRGGGYLNGRGSGWF